MISYWELKVSVTLHFGDQSPWSRAIEKGIDFLVADSNSRPPRPILTRTHLIPIPKNALYTPKRILIRCVRLYLLSLGRLRPNFPH